MDSDPYINEKAADYATIQSLMRQINWRNKKMGKLIKSDDKIYAVDQCDEVTIDELKERRDYLQGEIDSINAILSDETTEAAPVDQTPVAPEEPAVEAETPVQPVVDPTVPDFTPEQPAPVDPNVVEAAPVQPTEPVTIAQPVDQFISDVQPVVQPAPLVLN